MPTPAASPRGLTTRPGVGKQRPYDSPGTSISRLAPPLWPRSLRLRGYFSQKIAKIAKVGGGGIVGALLADARRHSPRPDNASGRRQATPLRSPGHVHLPLGFTPLATEFAAAGNFFTEDRKDREGEGVGIVGALLADARSQSPWPDNASGRRQATPLRFPGHAHLPIGTTPVRP